MTNNLEGLGGNQGQINFIDPFYYSENNHIWYQSNEPKTYSSPYYIDNNSEYSYGGIFLNQDPTFDPDIPNYSVQAVNGDVPMGGKYGTRPFYFQRWVESDGIQFEHSGNATTGVVFTSSGATTIAIMKGHCLSDKETAFNSNAQRNLVRDVNSIYHLFYISMNKIWHTKSLTSNFYGSWSQEEAITLNPNCSYPLSLSVDYNGNDQIAIVYIAEDGPSMYHTIINKNTGATIETHSYSDVTLDYNYINNILPVVAFSLNELITIYKPSGNGGLYYVRRSSGNGWLDQGPFLIPNTNFTSLNPTIASVKDGPLHDYLYLAFQQGNINTTINYCELYLGGSFDISTISTGSGYNINYSPSISLYRISNPIIYYKPMVSWTARTTGTLSKPGSMEGAEIPEPRMVCRQKNSDNTWGSCFVAGQYVNYSNNNSVISGGVNQSVIVWSELNGVEAKWVRRDGTSYSGNTCLEPAGLIPNVSTGINFSSIKAFTSDATTMPTILNPAITNFNSTPECNQQKVLTLYNLTYSRSGVVIKNGIEFVFNTGDIINGDSVIRFIEKPDTLIYNSSEELNSSLRTKDFPLNQNSSLLFTNYYYVINKEASDSLLSETESVNFKVELVNSTTNQVAGTFDNITFTKDNLDDYENVSYEIDCSGISGG